MWVKWHRLRRRGLLLNVLVERLIGTAVVERLGSTWNGSYAVGSLVRWS